MITMRESIGKKIVLLREKKGWSQIRLSTESGVDNSDLSRIEHGNKNLCLDTLEKIYTALGISYNEFFSNLE